MDKYINQAKTLMEALPYIKKFNNKIIVIKYGGSAMIDEQLKMSVIKDITLMKLVGIKPVVVHGGGKKINEMLSKIGKESVFIDGLRVTDDDTMEIAEMVLSGNINKSIVQMFQQQGIKAVGISGKDGMTIQAEKNMPGGKDIGWVGEIKQVNPELIISLIEDDFVPVVAPIATDKNNHTYNINADYVASAVASSLKAEKLIYLTDVEGVLRDINDLDTLISRINVNDIESMKEEKTITGGMIPKLDNCRKSIEDGVNSVHILDGRQDHCLLLELFTNSGIGTMIYKTEDQDGK
ncbi:acetylglutamate kinase [Alkalibacter mobilis]|uniref:acetylglutamate kinase n=1 Tax=Alkalibacter mobilis TaxID=2787712 RepID=UPI00189CFD17|nr:acetylglutamate kinase [Alkalibacter mobilis]MBF7096519.1 acetylglutamate kinase [Alkalibacter mobilis]